MLPGNNRIVTCPFCGTEKELFSLDSGNSFGVVKWSDAKMIYPMMPSVPPLQRCPECGKFYWTDDQEMRYSERSFGEIGWITWPEVEEAYRQLTAAETAVDKHYQEFRLFCWWAFNDYFYRGEEKHEPTPEDIRLRNRILEELLPVWQGQLIGAEVLREMGRFNEAIAWIDGLDDEQKEPKEVAARLLQATQDGNEKVFVLTKYK